MHTFLWFLKSFSNRTSYGAQNFTKKFIKSSEVQNEMFCDKGMVSAGITVLFEKSRHWKCFSVCFGGFFSELKFLVGTI